MRKPSKTSIATKVRKRIERGGKDRLWTYPDFRGFPTLAVAATLSRLSKGPNALIHRVRKGVYYVSKKTRFGETKPELDRVMANLLLSRGIAYSPTGTAAYNNLGLTTQVSPKITYRVNKPLRSIEPGRDFNVKSITLRPSCVVEGLHSSELTALDAFKDLRRIPGTTPAETVARIVNLIESERLSFGRLARLARRESPRVRALVGAIGSHIGASSSVVAGLKKSLNPLTAFHLDIRDALPNAAEWRIQ
jgi:hypothetical protein